MRRPEAVVKLGEGSVVAAGEKGDQRLVREVRKVSLWSGAFAHGGSIQR